MPAPITYQPARSRGTLTALCRGDVYEFQVHTDLEWSADGMSYDALVRQADRYQSSVDDRHRRGIWRIARAFGAHQAAEVERALERELGTLCFDDTNEGQIKCTSYFRVRPDARVLDHLTTYVLRDVDAGSEAALARRRVEAVRGLVGDWSHLLTEIGVSPVKLAAANLTDSSFSGVLSWLADRRHASGKELAELLSQAGKDHGQLGMYEFAELYASLLAAYMRQMEAEDSKFVREVMDIEPAEPAR